jgi:hypothetical protein
MVLLPDFLFLFLHKPAIDITDIFYWYSRYKNLLNWMFENVVRNLKGTVTKDIKIADREVNEVQLKLYVSSLRLQPIHARRYNPKYPVPGRLGGPYNTFRTQRQTKEPFIVNCYFNAYTDYVQYEITWDVAMCAAGMAGKMRHYKYWWNISREQTNWKTDEEQWMFSKWISTI